MDKDNKGSFGLGEAFKSFAQADDDKGSSGESIGRKNVENWLQKAGLLGDDKGAMSSSDLSTSFQKVAKDKDRLNMSEFQQFIEEWAKSAKMESKEVYTKLMGASSTGLSAVKDVLCKGKDAAKNLMGSGKGQEDKDDPSGSAKDMMMGGGKGLEVEDVKDAAKNLMGQEASKDKDAMDKDMDAKKK